MKRSEALGIIKAVFMEVTYENIAEKKAEEVLSKLEEAGMLPPDDWYFISDINNNKLGKVFQFCWEQEDEES